MTGHLHFRAACTAFAIAAAVALAGPARAAPGAWDPESDQRVAALLPGMLPALQAVYEDIHAHPELAFAETRTAAKLAGEMRGLGFEVARKSPRL